MEINTSHYLSNSVTSNFAYMIATIAGYVTATRKLEFWFRDLDWSWLRAEEVPMLDKSSDVSEHITS